MENDWQDVGAAVDVVALAGTARQLYAATSTDRLQRRDLDTGSTAWVDQGSAVGFVAMAALDGVLYAATRADRLFRRVAEPADATWLDDGAAVDVTALAALDGKLYAATRDILWARNATGRDTTWHRHGAVAEVTAMTGAAGFLFATTSDGSLWSRRADDPALGWNWLGYSVHWLGSSQVLGLAAAGGAFECERRLWAAADNDRLWQREMSFPRPHTRLWSWWQPDRHDLLTTSAPDWWPGGSEPLAQKYRLFNHEGRLLHPELPQQPVPNPPRGTVPLLRWHSPSRQDQVSTTDPTWGDTTVRMPPDYTFVRHEGFVYHHPYAGTASLYRRQEDNPPDGQTLTMMDWDDALGRNAIRVSLPGGRPPRLPKSVEGYVLPPTTDIPLSAPEPFGYMSHPRLGRRPLLVIVADFEDVATTTHMSYWHSLFEGPQRPNFGDYVAEVSAGRFRFDPIFVIRTQIHQPFGSVTNFDETVIRSASQAGVHMSIFDTDNDGILTGDDLTIMIISPARSEPEHASGGQTRDRPRMFVDGLALEGVDMICSCGELGDLRLYLHEAVHALTDEQHIYGPSFALNKKASVYASSGSRRSDGGDLVHLDPWNRILMGWLKPRVVRIGKPGGVARLPAAQFAMTGGELGPLVFYDPTRSMDEFFVVEYRSATPEHASSGNYDANVTDTGVAIWYVRRNPPDHARAGLAAGILWPLTNKLFRRRAVESAAGWSMVGPAANVRALAAHDGVLFGTRGDSLFGRRIPDASSAWGGIDSSGPAVRALAADDGKLWGVTDHDRLVLRDAVASPRGWRDIDVAPSLVGLAVLDGKLWGATLDGKIVVRDAVAPRQAWAWMDWDRRRLEALTAVDGKLWGATSDGDLVVRDPDDPEEDWQTVDSAYHVQALASADGWLWAAGSDTFPITDHPDLADPGTVTGKMVANFLVGPEGLGVGPFWHSSDGEIALSWPSDDRDSGLRLHVAEQDDATTSALVQWWHSTQPFLPRLDTCTPTTLPAGRPDQPIALTGMFPVDGAMQVDLLADDGSRGRRVAQFDDLNGRTSQLDTTIDVPADPGEYQVVLRLPDGSLSNGCVVTIA